MRFAVIKQFKNPDRYRAVISNDVYLETMASFFWDHMSSLKIVYSELIDPRGRGRAGNETSIDIDGSVITIGYFYAPEESIVVDRQELIKIISKVIALLDLDSECVVLTHLTADSSIEVTDQLPHGLEIYKENKSTKFRFNI
ncbi:hypothetical protein Noda2021_04080 [Candidatus Dependentiae bacterium Noda2021]|nr:hypothetical protein Noda2021_04080 [Candidatus Dependentiae bacterium Noda2021]